MILCKLGLGCKCGPGIEGDLCEKGKGFMKEVSKFTNSVKCMDSRSRQFHQFLSK